MEKNILLNIMNDLNVYKSSVESYKKRFWLKKNSLDESQKKRIQSLFSKMDSLRNGLLLHVKQLAKKGALKYNEKPAVVENSKKKMNRYFQQIDALFLSFEKRF